MTANAGILIATYSIVLFLFVLTFFLLFCIRRTSTNKCAKCVVKMDKCLTWNFVLRLLVETYLDLGLCALLNLYGLKFQTPLSIFSSCLAFFFLIIYLLLPFFSLRVITQP